MIILSRNSNYFDIKELSTKIFNKTNSLNEKCALHLITSGGLSLIKSFILAPYGDEFRNVFNEYYEEDYPKLLAKFKELGDEENNYILSNEIIGMTELRRKK